MKAYSLLAPVAKRLEGTVAVITGGASGIGETTTKLFLQHPQTKNEEAFSFIHCDVSVDSDVKNVVDTTIAKHGKPDIMFINAGIPGDIMDPRISAVDYQDFKRVFDTNVFRAFLCVKHGARVMAPAKKGSIIFTASVASVTCENVPHAYVASKRAVVALTKNLCVELGNYGIRVNCISPFAVATPMLRKCIGNNMEKAKLEEFVSEIANLKEATVEADDVASAVLYLGSDEANKYVSGLNLVVDGRYSTTNIAMKEGLKKDGIILEHSKCFVLTLFMIVGLF